MVKKPAWMSSSDAKTLTDLGWSRFIPKMDENQAAKIVQGKITAPTKGQEPEIHTGPDKVSGKILEGRLSERAGELGGVEVGEEVEVAPGLKAEVTAVGSDGVTTKDAEGNKHLMLHENLNKPEPKPEPKKEEKPETKKEEKKPEVPKPETKKEEKKPEPKAEAPKAEAPKAEAPKAEAKPKSSPRDITKENMATEKKTEPEKKSRAEKKEWWEGTFKEEPTGHTPEVFKLAVKAINKLIDKIKGWKKQNKGSLENDQKKYIKDQIAKIGRLSKRAKSIRTAHNRVMLLQSMRNLRKELGTKEKLVKQTAQRRSRDKRGSWEEEKAKRGEKQKKGYQSYLTKKREEKKAKEASTEQETKKRAEKQKKGYQEYLERTRMGKEATPEGLSEEEYHGLRKKGHTPEEIKKMGIHAAKASYWS
jgi:hypothetical protein